MSRIIKGSLGLAVTVLLGSVAQAGTPAHTTCYVPPKPCVSCVGPKTGTSTLPPLSSYFDHQAHCGTVYKPAPKVVHHAPVPSYKHHGQKHRPKYHHPKKPCVVVVHQTTTHCTTVIKKVHRPIIVHPPKVHPPIVRPPVVRPPVIYPPRPRYVRVIRPIIPVPYPVPVPVTYPVYAPCQTTAPCQPVRHYSRYGG